MSPSDEQHRTRRNRFYVVERIEIHKLSVAAQCRVRCDFRRTSLRRVFASRSAIEIKKFALDRMSVFIQLMDSPARVFGFAAGKLRITLLGSLGDDFLSLLKRLRFVQRVAARRSHIVHADGGDGFHSRVDFSGADNKASAAANSDNADSFPVNKRASAEKINCRAEIFGIDIRRDDVARLARAFAPER